MVDPLLPRAQAPLTPGGPPPTPEWHSFWSALFEFLANSENVPAEIQDLLQRVAALENAGGLFTLAGIASINVQGTPAQGAVQISLWGDNSAPGKTYYYGTNADGAKGWSTLESAFEVEAAELSKAVDPDTGVTTFGLADLADTGVGAALWKFTRDQWGRVEGTEAATTDDLAEGVTNLYFTDERAQDAVGAILDGTGDVPLTYDDAGNKISAALSAAVLASLALADSALQPHAPIVGIGAGTPYTLTASPAPVDMGTSDPSIVIDEPGTYLLRGYVKAALAAGTIVAETFALAFSRTNNTPADLPDSALTFAPAPATAASYTIAVIPLPEVVYTTANNDDELTITASLSAALSAGDLQITGAQILAHKID